MKFEFYDCVLDTDALSLEKAGEEVHVKPKVLDLLIFLITHRSSVVTHTVLMCEIWPDSIVCPAALSQIVKEARRSDNFLRNIQANDGNWHAAGEYAVRRHRVTCNIGLSDRRYIS